MELGTQSVNNDNTNQNNSVGRWHSFGSFFSMYEIIQFHFNTWMTSCNSNEIPDYPHHKSYNREREYKDMN